MANPYYYPVYYVQMWTRFPPYLVGILHWTKQLKFRMSQVCFHQIYNFSNQLLSIPTADPINQMAVSFGWIAATTVSLCVVYGMVPYLDESVIPEMNDAIRVTFGAFNRLAWAIAVGWVIFACTNGYGGKFYQK